MASIDDMDAEFARELSLLDIIVLGIGAMIGGSIFVLTGLAAGEAGPAIILAFALNGIITIFTAMVYAELGSAIPEPGGGYLWVREALGRPHAFLSGWISWFAHAVAGSLYILSFGSFVTLIITGYFGFDPGLAPVTLQKLFALLAVIVFTYVNYRGAKEASRVENLVTFFQLSIVLVFIIVGLMVLIRQPNPTVDFDPFLPQGVGGVFLAMGLTFIAFEGYEIIVQSGREVVNPRENIPKAIFYSMLIVVTIYILVGIVLIGAVQLTPGLVETAQQTDSIGGSTVPELPADPAVWQVLGHLGEFGLAQAAGQLLPYGTLLILVTGILSALAALNATTFSSSRVGYAMGQDRVFPDSFSYIHAKYRTPHISILLSGGLIAVMAVLLPLAQVAAAADLMFLLLFLQVNYSMIKIRRERGDELTYGYIAPLFPYIPILGIITKLLLAMYFFNYSPLAWYIAIGWILAGVGLFFVYSRGRIRETEIARETRAISEERALVERPYQVVVAISNPETAKRLVTFGSRIARHHNGEVLLTTVVTVPVQTPLEEGANYITNQRELLAEAMRYVPEDIPAHRVVTIGRNVGRSIVNLAQERDSELVILGWRGRSKPTKPPILGTTIDYIVENTPCDLVIAKTEGPNTPRNILLPTVGGPHAAFIENIATAFTDDERVSLTLLYVDENDTDAVESLLLDRQTALQGSGVNASIASISATNVSEAIIQFAEAGEYDTIMMGITRGRILQRSEIGHIAEDVGEQFSGEVLLGKYYQPLQSPLIQWLRKRRDEQEELTEENREL
ncbi:putative fructoselysine transporter [Halalkalicoccus paucihalophilus]|uniref:Putative fructoselysine transporter n=1 Tax=Halalkalicoccus paucihalophilus TaxID=1008153 RepID=A0A151AA93_9EURY|nr:amino acid permease [Halalkalicoccus paucihalophilus]KYH24618.1 putative fructoselysine transporter [Halalkalicoccus paucihalophilus]